MGVCVCVSLSLSLSLSLTQRVRVCLCVCESKWPVRAFKHKHIFYSSRSAYLHCIYVDFMYYRCMHTHAQTHTLSLSH